MTEAELVKALRRGSPDALAELIDCYTPYIPSVIARILRGRQADVEELTADVFLAAWNNRDKLRPGQVKGYLGTIARNRAFNRLRSECESLPLEDDILLLETDGPDRLLDRRETARMVNQALSRLERPQRELFVRHYYYGQTVQEAALAHGDKPVHRQDLAAPGARDAEKRIEKGRVWIWNTWRSLRLWMNTPTQSFFRRMQAMLPRKQ